jgi:catechol 2,3-dioxygenase-like lactoylglutathione lyase family enzyme
MEPRCPLDPRTSSQKGPTLPLVDEAIPVLRVADADAAARWYEAIGYVKEWEHQFEPGLPWFVSISRPSGARLYLSEHTGDATPDTLVHLVIEDLEDVAAAVGQELRTQPWGRELHLTDPDGNRLRIGEPA